MRKAAIVVLLSGWVLWHDVAVYRAAARTRIADPTYPVAAYARRRLRGHRGTDWTERYRGGEA